MTTNEFARPVRIDTLGDAARSIEVSADPQERAALARRFGLVAIDRLEGVAALRRTAAGIAAEGHVIGEVVQACVATGAPLSATIDESFALRFVAEDEAARDATEEEVELGADELDTIGYVGGAVDIGEAMAETLALALDPFPRSPDADAALKAAGVLREDEAGPFAALKGLRDKIGK